MKTHIAYGRSSLEITIPDECQPTVLRSGSPPALDDPEGAVRAALQHPTGTQPLASYAAGQEGHGRAGIVFNDISRATPNHLIIPPIIEELTRAGIRREDVTLFNATGTHRSNTHVELESILTPQLVRDFRIVQNDCTAETAHTTLGTTPAGNTVKVLKEFLDCDVRVATGFIEPHFFAGYSGGGKAVVPGLAHLDTILFNHGPEHMDHNDATWGKTKGNPLWEDLAAAASMADPVFLVNVAMNNDKEITAVFAGDREKAHSAGCNYVAHHATVPVDRLYDVVVTSNSGYPLDLNLYQAVKGMSAAARIVRPGGEIIVAAECWDGLPEHGLFAELTAHAESAKSLLDTLRTDTYRVRDAWQAHVFARLALKARITLVSSGVGPDQVPRALCGWAPSVESALEEVRERAGHALSVCVLPDGPLTIPRFAG